MIGPVPFIVDEDSIRITDNSIIGNGLAQINAANVAHQRGSRAEKLQNDQKVNTSGSANGGGALASIPNQGGFIQVRPIFQAQSLTTKGSPLKNVSHSPNK